MDARLVIQFADDIVDLLPDDEFLCSNARANIVEVAKEMVEMAEAELALRPDDQ